MPWRKPGNQQISSPIPFPTDGYAGQPPTLPDDETADPSVPIPPAASLSAEFDRVSWSTTPTITSPNAKSMRLSRRMLVLFSDPCALPDELIASSQWLGLHVSILDNDAFNNDDTAHNLPGSCMFVSTLRRTQCGKFLAAFAALPYSILSISRSIRSDDSADGCLPIIRRLSHDQVIAMSGCLQTREGKLKQSNEPVTRTCASLHAIVEAGSEFAMENPADQGNLSHLELLIYPNHAPIRLMSDILALRDHSSCLLVAPPMLAFGGNYEGSTIVMCAPNLSCHLEDLRNLQCDAEPTSSSGGREVNGIWNSAANVTYPTELDLWITLAIAQLATTHRGIGLHSPLSKLMEGLYNILHEASSNDSSNPTPVPSRKGYPHSSSTLPTGYSDAIPMPAPIGPLANDLSPQLPLPKGKPRWFTH